MQRQKRRTITQLTSILLFVLLVSGGSYIWKQTFEKKTEKYTQIAAEEKPILDKVDPQKEKLIQDATVSQLSAVLAEEDPPSSGKVVKGRCGGKWTWGCDNSDQNGAYMNGKTYLSVEPKALTLDSISFMNNLRQYTETHNTSIHVALGGIDKGTFEWCDESESDMKSLAAISISQPILPKIVEGTNFSLREVAGYPGKVATLTAAQKKAFEDLPEDQYKRLCDPNDPEFAYIARMSDTFHISSSSKGKSQDGPQSIIAGCAFAIPAPDEEIVTTPESTIAGFFSNLFNVLQGWLSLDSNKKITAYLLSISNNEEHNAVRKEIQDIINGNGYKLGLISPGAGYLNTYVYSIEEGDKKLATSKSMSYGIVNYSDVFASPLKSDGQVAQYIKGWCKDPATDGNNWWCKNYYKEAKNNSDFNRTLVTQSTITTLGGGVLQEGEKETIKNALFGGFYFINAGPNPETSNTIGTLSYDPERFRPGTTEKYNSQGFSCDPYEGGNCPLIAVNTGCASAGNAKAKVRVKNLLLSTESASGISNVVNDGTRTTVTTGGDLIENTFNSPVFNSLYSQASLYDILKMSKRTTSKCTAMLDDSYAKNPTIKKLTDEQQSTLASYISSCEGMFCTQVLVMTPLKMKVRAYLTYKADMKEIEAAKRAITTLNNQLKAKYKPKKAPVFRPGKNFTDAKEWNVIIKDKTILRPAFYSWKIDELKRGLGGYAPNSAESKEIDTLIDTYLAQQNIINYNNDWAVDCKEIPTEPGEERREDYWFCSKSGTLDNGVLPKCGSFDNDVTL